MLFNVSQDNELATNVLIAKSFWQKTKGLIGKKRLLSGEVLLITNCRSVHTCFMKFAIDLIYIDGHDQIVKIERNLRPYRFSFGPYKAVSVYEFNVGELDLKKCSIGDIVTII